MRKLINVLITFLLFQSLAYAGVEFDGGGTADDVIDVGTDDIWTENGPITMSVWLFARTGGEGGIGRVLERADNRFIINTTGSRVSWAVNGATDGERLTATNSWIFNQWHHLWVTWDGGTNFSNCHIYIDGVEPSYFSTTNQVTPTDNSGQTLFIGNRSDGVRTFDGIIDELYIWNSDLGPPPSTMYAGRVKRQGLNISPSTLVRYWALDEGVDGSKCETTGMFKNTAPNTIGSGNGTHSNSPTGRASRILSYP